MSDKITTEQLEQAKDLVEHLNKTFKGCKAHMIIIEEVNHGI